MIREYLLISWATMVMFLSIHPEWSVMSHETRYRWPDGRTVMVADAQLIDSLGLRGWDDIKVVYPINENDSNHVHIVYVHDSDIVN